jgi:glycosyltransferase involved in cell wall biosynthesis
MAASTTGSRPRVLVLEPHSPGHHATYLRWIVEAIVARGWTAVVATTDKAMQHPLLGDLAQRGEGVEIRIVDADMPLGAISGRIEVMRRELLYWLAMRDVVRAEHASHALDAVVLPYLDYCFFTCCILGVPYGGVPWHVISMRLSAVGAASGDGVPWRWRLVRRLLSSRSLATLFAISPSVRDLPTSWFSRSMTMKLQYLPDPAEQRGGVDRGAARARVGLRPEQLAVLVFGSIDERKGLGRLAAALAADSRLGDYVLIVAGAQAPDIRAAATEGALAQLRAAGRLIVLDRTLDDAEQALVFAAADVAWLGYERHAFMSGVLVLAGQAALPVIATDFGEIGVFVRRHRIGLLVDAEGDQSVRDALAALLNPALRNELGAQSLAALKGHTPERLKELLIAAIAMSRRNSVG